MFPSMMKNKLNEILDENLVLSDFSCNFAEIFKALHFEDDSLQQIAFAKISKQKKSDET